MGESMATSAFRSMTLESLVVEGAEAAVDEIFEAAAHLDSRPVYGAFFFDEDEDVEIDVFADPTIDGSMPAVPASAEVAAMPVVVNVLGPVDVLGWRVMPQRKVITELACYLALHPRLISGEELRAALWPESSSTVEANAKSLRNYLSELRRSMGPDAVRSIRGSGYGLSPSVVCDWDRFVALSSVPAGADGEVNRLIDALTLVRGRPFAGVTYSWVYSELLVSEIEVAIASTARRLATLLVSTGEADNAVFGLRRALLACPYDISLWELALEASAGVSAEEMARTWRDAQAALGDDAGELTDLKRRLEGN
jgi:DNA-binding SARP family transcriptional activator